MSTIPDAVANGQQDSGTPASPVSIEQTSQAADLNATSASAPAAPPATDNLIPSPLPGDQPPAAPAAPVDWEKRHRDTQSALTKASQLNKQHEQQLQKFQGLDPERARAALATQDRDAAALKLKTWHPRHPEFKQTDQRIVKARSYLQTIETLQGTLPDDQFRATALRLANQHGVTKADVDLVQEYDGHVKQQNEAFARDPDAFIQEAVGRQIGDAFKQFEHYQASQRHTEQFMTAHAPLVDKYAADIVRAMDGGQQVGIEYAQMKAELESLRAQVSQSAGPLHTAEAQREALAGNATVRRDTRTTPSQSGFNALAEAQKQGLTGAALYRFLNEHKTK